MADDNKDLDDLLHDLQNPEPADNVTANPATTSDLESRNGIVNCSKRVGPLVKIFPYKPAGQQWVDPWEGIMGPNGKRAKSAPGSVTVIVRILGDNQNLYILTVGHAFYEADSNRANSSQVTFHWGEPNPALPGTGPHSTSQGPYYFPADVRHSSFDAGLICLNDNIPWCNIYNFTTPKETFNKRLIALDQWPPRTEGGFNIYRIRELTIPYDEFQVCESFTCNLAHQNGNPYCTLKRVMLRIRGKGPKGDYDYNFTSLYKSASGSALIRYKTDSDDAIVVGMLLGCASQVIVNAENGRVTTGDAVYDIFQHISMAKEALGLSKDLPQYN